MALFDIALALVLKHEGGFANVAADRGGATNFGISTPTYSRYLGRPATVADIKAMPMKAVETIYRQDYWLKVRGDDINQQATASYLMDMAVLMGPASAIRLMQTAVGGLTADGIIGPKSIARLNAIDPVVFALVFSKACVSAFVAITTANPTQLVFLPGWVKRAHEMTDIRVA